MNDAPLQFEDIYSRYLNPINTLVARMVGVGDADDVTQEVFAKIDKGLKKFEGRARLSTWIYRIATNTALDRLRSRRSKPNEIPLLDESASRCTEAASTGPAAAANPLQNVILSEMNDCIREQVDKLPEKYKTVLVLSSLEELKNPEIADILDISVDNVKIRLHRARKMLKQILETQCRFYHNSNTGAFSCDRKS